MEIAVSLAGHCRMSRTCASQDGRVEVKERRAGNPRAQNTQPLDTAPSPPGHPAGNDSLIQVVAASTPFSSPLPLPLPHMHTWKLAHMGTVKGATPCNAMGLATREVSPSPVPGRGHAHSQLKTLLLFLSISPAVLFLLSFLRNNLHDSVLPTAIRQPYRASFSISLRRFTATPSSRPYLSFPRVVPSQDSLFHNGSLVAVPQRARALSVSGGLRAPGLRAHRRRTPARQTRRIGP